jgi:hypothetical protein
VNTNYYAVRVQEMKTRLLSKFPRKANDVFVLGGKRRKDLLDIVTLGKTVQSFCLGEVCVKNFRENKRTIIF